MWMPRVKIYLNMNHRLPKNKLNKWNFILENNGKKLLYRYIENNYIEFALCFFNNKKDALLEGKKLYFNVLVNGYKCNYLYAMGDEIYIAKAYIEEVDGPLDTYYKNQEFFFSTKDHYSNGLGLMIYEVSSIDDYDKFYKSSDDMTLYWGFDESIMTIINGLTEYNNECYFDEDIQHIFHLFSLAERAENGICTLLLCQILESFGKNEEKSDEIRVLIEKCMRIIKNSDIDLSEKDSLLSSINGLKYESSRKKIKNVLDKYNKINYKDFDKYEVVKKSYSFRSYIIHGEFSKVPPEIYMYESYLKTIVLDTFCGWVKINKIKNTTH